MCRFRSDNELITSLEAITEELNKKHYLISSLPSRNKFFIGRAKELNQLHELLRDNRIVFLSGVGGICKSKFTIEYGNVYASEYDSVSFGICDYGVKEFITDDKKVNISAFCPLPSQKQNDYYRVKINKLRELVDSRTLIIVDNFNDVLSEGVGELADLNCKFIITTRAAANELSYPVISVAPLTPEECRRLFYEYYRDSLTDNEEETLSKLLERTQYNTFLIELLSKQMRSSDILPSDVLKYFGYSPAENSTRVITIKVKDTKNSKILHSVDFAIIRDCENDYGDYWQEYIRFNKKNNVYNWAKQDSDYEVFEERMDWIESEELMEELWEMYLRLKNNNKVESKHSIQLLTEAVDNIYHIYCEE
ncbi:MAG: ATP-binding protein [Clostridiales bacterium]|nr:ATP-binding protein [Clostridiales bacterium]